MPELNSLYDARLRGHLRRLLDADPHGRSIIVLMGDHGPRGGCDEANPGLWLVVGRAVLRRSPGLAAALRNNRNRLVSMLDLHETLLGLLRLPRLRSHAIRVQQSSGQSADVGMALREDFAIPSNETMSASAVRGEGGSLWHRDKVCRTGPCNFATRPVAVNRTCAEALIHPLYCSCADAWQGRKDTPYDRAMALALMQYINRQLEPGKEQCAWPLELLRVVNVRARTFSECELPAEAAEGDPAWRRYCRQRWIQATAFELETVQSLRFAVKLLSMDSNLLLAHPRSLACIVVMPFEGRRQMCLAQLSALHRFAKFQPCAPPTVEAHICFCPREAHSTAETTLSGTPALLNGSVSGDRGSILVQPRSRMRRAGAKARNRTIALLN